MASRNVLKDRYRQVMDRVAEAAEKHNRRPADIVTVAVTKYAAPDQMRQLIELGHQDLGESRVQQLQQRVAMCREFLARHRMMESSRHVEMPDQIRWHMIGHLQRNKVKPILPMVKLIHSVDSLRLAEELQTQAARADLDIEILLQINPMNEPSKYGLAPPAVSHLADQIQTMLHLRLRGLMAMAPLSENPDDARPAFERTAELFADMLNSGDYGDHFNILSMGMTDDFEIAIACGANLLRLGRAFFGEPVPSASQ